MFGRRELATLKEKQICSLRWRKSFPLNVATTNVGQASDSMTALMKSLNQLIGA